MYLINKYFTDLNSFLFRILIYIGESIIKNIKPVLALGKLIDQIYNIGNRPMSSHNKRFLFALCVISSFFLISFSLSFLPRKTTFYHPIRSKKQKKIPCSKSLYGLVPYGCQQFEPTEDDPNTV